MPSKPSQLTEITQEKVILVEGEDEVNFFEALLNHLGLANIQIIQVGGKDQFRVEFPTFLTLPNINKVTAYAIIRDADTSDKATFESIRKLLYEKLQPCPQQQGQFASSASLKVGVFITPGNAETGMLENLCLQTVVDHPIIPCVESFMNCLKGKIERKKPEELRDEGKAYYPKNEHKAKVQAFLAGMYETTVSLGLAAKKGYWPFDHMALANLRNFLKKLGE